MPTPADERRDLLERYAHGPALLRAAFQRCPAAAVRWRPAPERWSVHEVVCHCADSETISSTRIRFLAGVERATIQGYDPDHFARLFAYHDLPLDLALAQIEQVRAWTSDLIRRFPAEHWARTGTHTESGVYSAATWLKNYAEHLETHARQIDRNVAEWGARQNAPGAAATQL